MYHDVFHLRYFSRRTFTYYDVYTVRCFLSYDIFYENLNFNRKSLHTEHGNVKENKKMKAKHKTRNASDTKDTTSKVSNLRE